MKTNDILRKHSKLNMLQIFQTFQVLLLECHTPLDHCSHLLLASHHSSYSFSLAFLCRSPPIYINSQSLELSLTAGIQILLQPDCSTFESACATCSSIITYSNNIVLHSPSLDLDHCSQKLCFSSVCGVAILISLDTLKILLFR